MKRCVFIGAVDFSARCLDAMLEDGVRFEAVLCPDRPGRNSDYRDLAPVAERFGVKARHFRKIADEADFIMGLEPDLVFVLGLSQILPASVLSSAKMGCLGSHPALLPRNRGRHPIIWTLANGLTEGGITLFWLDEGVDSGDIWAQRRFPVTLEDDAGSVYEKVCAHAVELLREGLPALLDGRVERTPQDEAAANSWRRRTRKDGEIDWRMSSRRIYDLVRALRPPYVGAHCRFEDGEVKVWRVREIVDPDRVNIEPGKVVAQGDSGPIVKTGDGLVEIAEHEFPRKIEVGEYLT